MVIKQLEKMRGARLNKKKTLNESHAQIYIDNNILYYN